ncbi:MAG: cupin domain-containing protein [Parachlamydiales bacterium]|jgi:oxalate decarboxylase
MASATHLFSLGKIKPQTIRSGGSRTDVTVQQLPILNGLSLSYLVLEQKGVREPHWHPNANELSYCVEGSALMTIFTPGAGHDTFTITAGEIVFVPMGALHHIVNTGEKPFKLLICFDSETPEDLDLSAGISVMPDHILAATFSVNESLFSKLPKEPKSVFITTLEEPEKPPIPFITNRFKMALDAENPQIQTKGGWVKMSNQFLLPTLQGISIYGVSLNKLGAREPHWHPNAAELNYLIEGTARITLLSPGGSADTFDMVAGDMSYMPKGYLHHIENTGEDPAKFAIFFNHIAPSDIGLSGCLGAYPNDVLAALFKVPAAYFDSLPKYQQDLFVISGGG